MLRLSAILTDCEKRFIEVFEETKPQIKLRKKNTEIGLCEWRRLRYVSLQMMEEIK